VCFFKERNDYIRNVVAGNTSDALQNCVVCSVRIQCAIVSYVMRTYCPYGRGTVMQSMILVLQAVRCLTQAKLQAQPVLQLCSDTGLCIFIVNLRWHICSYTKK
jgi:hypothetical protein